MSGSEKLKSQAKVTVPLVLGLLLWGCGLIPRYYSPSYHRGVYHPVRAGETLWRIARTYGVDLDELQRVNHVRDPRDLKIGRRLFIPGARRVLTVRLPEMRETDGKARPPSQRSKPAEDSSPRVASLPKPRELEFSWPLRGTITTYFGLNTDRRHDGLDIAAPAGTLIKAAAPGKVVFSDWGPGGYGKMVILSHPGGFHTIYAHNRENLVRRGEEVAEGEPVARVGRTGRASGPHLHFEIRLRTIPKDPLFFLP